MELKYHKTSKEREKAVIVASNQPGIGDSIINEQLSELKFLALTSRANTLKTFVQNQVTPDNKTYVGKGKFNEIKAFIEENEIDC